VVIRMLGQIGFLLAEVGGSGSTGPQNARRGSFFLRARLVFGLAGENETRRRRGRGKNNAGRREEL
jgi:hypothetical protein